MYNHYISGQILELTLEQLWSGNSQKWIGAVAVFYKILLKVFVNLSHDDSICDCLERGTFG